MTGTGDETGDTGATKDPGVTKDQGEASPPSPPPPAPVPPAEATTEVIPPAGEARTETLPPSPAPPPPRTGFDFAAGWGKALVRAIVIFVVMVLVGEGLWGLIYAAGNLNLGVPDILKIGALFTYAFHRVGIAVEVPQFGIPGGTGSTLPGVGAITITFTIAIALLLGTLLLILLLYRGGRAVAQASGGGPLARGLHGMKIAPFYALLTLAASFAVTFSRSVPANTFFPSGGSVDVHPSYLGAILWPLGFALVFGFAGGVRSASEGAWLRTGDTGNRLRGAVSGAWVMLGWGLFLAFVGYVIAVNIDAQGAPFSSRFFTEAFQGDALGGISLIVTAVFLIPNIAGLVLAPAMGSSLGFYGAGNVDVISLLHFPKGFNAAALQNIGNLGGGGAAIPKNIVQTGTAPIGYFLFLLVPLIAVLVGGRAAAKRGHASSAGGGAFVGAGAGVVFAALVFAASVLAGFGVKFVGGIAGFTQSTNIHIGANYLPTILYALGWGVIGGAIGGASVGRSAARPAEGSATGFAIAGSVASTRDESLPTVAPEAPAGEPPPPPATE